VLIVSPATFGGSWISLEELLAAHCKSARYVVATLGKYRTRGQCIAYQIPYLRYDKYGFIATNPARGFVYQLPLTVVSTILAIVYRPKAIIGNGILTCLFALPAAKITGSSLIVSYHSLFSRQRPFTKLLARALARHFRHVFANSYGTKADIAAIIPDTKVTVVEHWANDVFFEKVDRDRVRKALNVGNQFVVLYVGRLDREKQFDKIMRVSVLLRDREDIAFLFVGRGEFDQTIERLSRICPRVRYLGYICDRERLHEIYAAADIVCAYGEETYVARPGIEALASSTPIFLSARPAILLKVADGVTIPSSIIPREVGWIVDWDDVLGTAKMLLEIKERGTESARWDCRAYALARHSSKNLQVAIARLEECLPALKGIEGLRA